MDIILLIYGVPILLLLLCAWVQWFLVSHIKDWVVRLSASLVLPILTGFLSVVCCYQVHTVTGWDGLAWELCFLPWSCAALVGTLIGWLCGRLDKNRKKK